MKEEIETDAFKIATMKRTIVLSKQERQTLKKAVKIMAGIREHVRVAHELKLDADVPRKLRKSFEVEKDAGVVESILHDWAETGELRLTHWKRPPSRT